MIILPNGVAAIETDTHHRHWCAMADGLVHDRWFADQICQHLQPGQVAVDGGANIGTLTRAMLEKGASVHAFEPNDEARECLQYNCPQATIYPFGLSDKRGKAGIVRQANAGATFLTANGKEVVLRPLDMLNLNPHLIKLDLEGYELKALRGAHKTLTRCRPVLVLEVCEALLNRAGDSRDALFAFIDGLSYERRVIQPELGWQSEQYDVLCLPR